MLIQICPHVSMCLCDVSSIAFDDVMGLILKGESHHCYSRCGSLVGLGAGQICKE